MSRKLFSDLNPPEGGWEKLERKISDQDQKSRQVAFQSKHFWYLAAAAGIALVASVGGLNKHRNSLSLQVGDEDALVLYELGILKAPDRQIIQLSLGGSEASYREISYGFKIGD